MSNKWVLVSFKVLYSLVNYERQRALCYILSSLSAVDSSEEVDGALGLLKLEAAIKQMTPGKFQNSHPPTLAHLSIRNDRALCNLTFLLYKVNEAVHVEKLSRVSEEMEDLHFEHLLQDNPEKNNEMNVKLACLNNFGPTSDLYEDESEDLGSETTGGMLLILKK